jgi:hypothetical protein
MPASSCKRRAVNFAVGAPSYQARRVIMLKTLIAAAGLAGTVGVALPANADWSAPAPAPVYAPPVEQPVYGWGYGRGWDRDDGWHRRAEWRRHEEWERYRRWRHFEHERREHRWGW